jgi:hypothetical protein
MSLSIGSSWPKIDLPASELMKTAIAAMSRGSTKRFSDWIDIPAARSSSTERDREASHIEGAVDVDLHYAFPRVGIEVLDCCGQTGNIGIVDKNVKAAKRRNRCGNHHFPPNS